ncbi:unnamed protein product, partial [Rotaria socialis]
ADQIDNELHAETGDGADGNEENDELRQSNDDIPGEEQFEEDG